MPSFQHDGWISLWNRVHTQAFSEKLGVEGGKWAFQGRRTLQELNPQEPGVGRVQAGLLGSEHSPKGMQAAWDVILKIYSWQYDHSILIQMTVNYKPFSDRAVNELLSEACLQASWVLEYQALASEQAQAVAYPQPAACLSSATAKAASRGQGSSLEGVAGVDAGGRKLDVGTAQQFHQSVYQISVG